MKETKYAVDMHCASCQNIIEKALAKKGVEAQANAALKIVKVKYNEEQISSKEIINVIKKAGYDAQEK